MKNMDIKITGTKLTITVDLSKDQGLSKSLKSTIIATSEGNVDLDAAAAPGVKIGLNVYKAAVK
jgi:hypothetical protein